MCSSQRKLKIVAENAGFALVNGAIVRPDGAQPVPAPKPRKPRVKKDDDEPAAKKRKADVKEEGDNADAD